MAENPAGLTTEQLLMELGKVVLGLSRKVETLGEKMDAIHSVLADDISPALKATVSKEAADTEPLDMTPLLDKLDELKVVFSEQSPDQESHEPQSSDALSEKLQAIENVLSSDILPAIRELKIQEDIVPVDLSPIVDKIDSITAAIGDSKIVEQLKPLLEGLSASFDQLPSKMTDSLKELKDADSINPMENVEQKLTEVCTKLEEILKITEDREFVETLSTGISQVKEQLVLSSGQVVDMVKEVPEKIEKMGDDLSAAMKNLSETADTMLNNTEKNISESNSSLQKIKKELEKGLKLNTDMTSQMVDLTAKFTSKAEEDRITDLNTRAITHFNHGEYPESETLFSQALNLSPENSELLCNTAHLKAAMEDMEEAEKLFRKALVVSPDLEPAISGLGMLMVSTGRAEETIEFLKSSLTEGNPSVRTTIAYARALTALDKHDKAVEMLETTLRAAPDNHDLLDELAKYGHDREY